jgi:hypothetical protein
VTFDEAVEIGELMPTCVPSHCGPDGDFIGCVGYPCKGLADACT